MLEHLKRLELLTHFKAPSHRKISPIRVTKRKEYLELVTGGHVLFPGSDGKDTLYGRGTLFWHRGGENTIYRYHTDDPYSCYSIEFEVEGGGRICPRVTIPLHTETLTGFVEDVFRRYHAGESESPAAIVTIHPGPLTPEEDYRPIVDDMFEAMRELLPEISPDRVYMTVSEIAHWGFSGRYL